MLVLVIIFLAVFIIALQIKSWFRGEPDILVSLDLSDNLREPGETAEITITVTNRSRVFLPYLRINLGLPKGVTTTLEEKRQHLKLLGEDEVMFSTWLGPMQQITLRVPILSYKRGRYVFETISIRDGDFLGLKERRYRFDVFEELVVAPPAQTGVKIEEIPGSFPGDLSVSRFLFEDPVLTIGFREYSGREPMKSISWLASARTGRLMTKVYDHTMEASVAVVLNVLSDADDRDELVEKSYTLARAACQQLEERGIKYSFFTNAIFEDDKEKFHVVNEGLGRRHFLLLLEILGRSILFGHYSADKLLEYASGKSHDFCGILLITPSADAKVLAAARRTAARTGVSVAQLIAQEVNL